MLCQIYLTDINSKDLKMSSDEKISVGSNEDEHLEDYKEYYFGRLNTSCAKSSANLQIYDWSEYHIYHYRIKKRV